LAALPEEALEDAGAERLYRDHAERIERRLMPLNTRGIVTQVNREKEVVVVATGADRCALALWNRQPLARELKPGDFVELAVRPGADGNADIAVGIARCRQSPPADFTRCFDGRLVVNPRGFAFVGDVYIPASLSGAGRDGGMACGWAVLGRKRRDDPALGWRAVTLEPKAEAEALGGPGGG